METIASFKIVYATVKFIGFHRWKDAPAEVEFLKERHRHEFIVKGSVLVDNSDREVEFFTLAEKIKKYFAETYPASAMGYEFGGMSCEMIAEQVGYALGLYSCDVSEDGENGAIWQIKF